MTAEERFNYELKKWVENVRNMPEEVKLESNIDLSLKNKEEYDAWEDKLYSNMLELVHKRILTGDMVLDDTLRGKIDRMLCLSVCSYLEGIEEYELLMEAKKKIVELYEASGNMDVLQWKR